MKTVLKVRWLIYSLNRQSGFTLVELLVVILIIGILSAIAIPSMINQASKAKQAEAKQFVGAMNRAQQAYYLENVTFATSFSSLGLGVPGQTESYQYSVTTTGLASGRIGSMANSRSDSLLSYVGYTYTLIDSQGQATTAILCETTYKGSYDPSATGGVAECSPDGVSASGLKRTKN